MNLYVETSALLAWLFNEPSALKIARIFSKAEHIASSSLTVLEAERALIRQENSNMLKAAEVREMRNRLVAATSRWHLLRITDKVQSRASEKFPIEPVRTLDAIHLASALELVTPFPDLVVFSLDHRITDNLGPLGLVALD